jgi:hypothetical protein
MEHDLYGMSNLGRHGWLNEVIDNEVLWRILHDENSRMHFEGDVNTYQGALRRLAMKAKMGQVVFAMSNLSCRKARNVGFQMHTPMVDRPVNIIATVFAAQLSPYVRNSWGTGWLSLNVRSSWGRGVELPRDAE